MPAERMEVLPASRLLSTLPRSPANINIHCGIYQVVLLIDVYKQADGQKMAIINIAGRTRS